jgi:hypothetical protein
VVDNCREVGSDKLYSLCFSNNTLQLRNSGRLTWTGVVKEQTFGIPGLNTEIDRGE